MMIPTEFHLDFHVSGTGQVGRVETWNQWSVIPIAELDGGNICRNPDIQG